MTLPTMESLFKRVTKIRQRQLSYLTAEQAKDYGFDLEPGWAVSIDFGETPDATPTYKYISPERWEFSGFTYGDTGDVLEYTALSPEGKKYTKAELDIQQVEAKEYGDIITSLEPYKTPEGLYDIGKARTAGISEDVLTKVFGEIKPPEPIIPETVAPQSDEELIYKEYQRTGGKLSVPDWWKAGAPLRPEDETPTVTAPTVSPFGQSLIKALPLIVRPTTVDWAVQYFSKNPDKLRRELITAGRNPDTEALVKSLYPQITDRGLQDYFSTAALAVEAEAIETAKRGKGRLFTAGVGDLVANTGGVFKWLGAEGIGEKISKAGQFMQVQAQPMEKGEFKWQDLFDPSSYSFQSTMAGITRALPTLMLLAIPGIGAYGLAGSVAARVGIGAFGRAIITGIGGGALSRPLESAMEAASTYDEARNRGLSHEEANKAADKVFTNNLKLVGSDVAQIAVSFMPTPFGAAGSIVRRGLVKTAQIGGKLVFTGLTEGGEEIYQDILQRQALGEKVKLDPDMQQVFAIGALMGLGMGGGGDILMRITDRVVTQFNPEQKAQFDTDKANFKTQGLSDEVATTKAMDNVVEANPDLEKVVEDATKQVEKEITVENLKAKTPADQVVIDKLKQKVGVPAKSSELARLESQIARVRQDWTEATDVTKRTLLRNELNALEKQKSALTAIPKIPQVTGMPEAVKPAGATEVAPVPAVKETLPNQVRQIHSELEADVNIARKRFADIRTPDAQFGRLALNDANKLIKRAETLVNRIEQGQAVSEEEVNALRDKIASLKDYYKFEAKTTAQVKQKLVEYIKSQLPLPRQGELLAKVKNVRTQEQLTEAIARIEELAEAQTERTLRADIIRELKKTAPRIEKGITVGRLVPEVQPTIEKLRANLLVGIKGKGGIARNVEAYEAARAKIEQGISDYRDGKITWDALLEANEDLKYTGVYGMSSAQLQEALDYIQEMKRLGKDLRKIKREAIKEQRKEVVDKAVVEVTGGEGIKPGVGVLRGKDLAGIKKVLDQPVNSQYGFVNLLDKLGKFAKGTKQYKGFLMRFANLSQRAVNTENAGREAIFKQVRDKFREIYDVAKTREATRLLTTLTTEDVDLGTFKITTKEGVKYLPIKLTRAEMMEAYQLYKNPKNLETFKEGMHWTPEIMTKIVNTLTDQDITYADWLQNEFYTTYYDKINPFYQQEFNIDMPKNPDYVPQSRDFEAKIDETDEVRMLLQDQKRYASVTNKSLKAREANKRPFQFKGVFTVLTNHIVQMEHFMAWAETMHELRSTFGNTEVRTAIRQYHSNDILKRIDDYMNDFARGGVDRVQFLNALDKLRSNFAVSVLAIKPSIGLQQIWTVGAFMTEMKGKDFVTGMANFWHHPIENYKWMMENSTYIKNRYTGGNYERDIRLAQQQGVAKTMSGAGNISQYLLWQVTQGDKFGVMPGWWAKYQAGLKEGLSQADAITEADLASERTQNTSELASLSWLQRGSSWGKLLTMFQSQPNKYFRIIADNIRNMQYGRQSKVKGITNLLIVWVLLPMLFQWVADAFKWKKEKQARILLLGPLNNILVAGQLVQTAWGWFTDDSFDWQASPVLSTVRDFQNFSSKLMKIMGQVKDPYTDVVMDDIVSALEFFSKGIGQLTGAPTPYLIMVERAIRDGDPRELVFSRWALEEPTPDLQGKTNKLIDQLGQVVEDVTDLPIDKIPPVYDMKKAFSEVKESLSKTLPSDVTEKNGYRPQVVAIAQAIMAQDKLETYPNKRLFEIVDDILNDNTLNYTFSQYYMDYQDRQKIDSLAKLKDWDAEHPRYNLGNVTPAQFALMRQYEALETKAEKAQFRKDHPEINVNPRIEWLKAHPKENAQLAVWGQAKLLTKEAFNQFIGLVKSLDIPDSAIPPLTLPPETSIDTHFTYEDMVAEGKHGSWEVQLLLKKDAIKAKDAKVQSYADWKGLKLSDTPIVSLELKTKPEYRQIYDKIESFSDKSSPDYIADEKARAQAIKDLKTPEYIDNTRRIEAIEKGTDETPVDEKLVNAHVDYGKLQDKEGVGSSSAEIMLYRVDNPEYDKWRTDTTIWGDQALKPVDQTRIPIWRIDVKYTKEDAEYDAIKNPLPAEQARLRAEYMTTHEDYRKDDRRREAYDLSNPQTGEKFPTNEVENYVAYYEIPTIKESKRQERFIINNTAFAQAMYRITGKDIWLTKPEDVPNVAYDDLYDQFKDLFDEMRDNSDRDSKYYIKDIDERTARDKQLFDENPAFKEAYYRRQAYGELFEDKYVDNYTTYMLLPKSGYADERFLKTHQDFYYYAKKKQGWTSPDPEWDKIPTEEVETLYNTYQDLQRRKVGQVALDNFRDAHRDLDAWGVLMFGWTPIGDKKRRQGMTPAEKLAESAAALDIEFDKRMEELRKRLEKLKR